jgi:hypothetical protein
LGASLVRIGLSIAARIDAMQHDEGEVVCLDLFWFRPGISADDCHK